MILRIFHFHSCATRWACLRSNGWQWRVTCSPEGYRGGRRQRPGKRGKDGWLGGESLLANNRSATTEIGSLHCSTTSRYATTSARLASHAHIALIKCVLQFPSQTSHVKCQRRGNISLPRGEGLLCWHHTGRSAGRFLLRAKYLF